MKRLNNIIIAGIVLLSFAVGAYFYNSMPEMMVSLWNQDEQPDDAIGKFWGLFLFPIISAALALLFIILPKIDPLKKNIKKFRRYYDWFIILFLFFMLYIYIIVVLWNLGHDFDMNRIILPAFAVLFFYIGIMTGHARQNWFIGIRTPWTISNKKVWDKTNKLAGKLFKIAAVVSLAGLLFKDHALWFLLIPVLLAAGYPIAYSYFEYQKQSKKI